MQKKHVVFTSLFILVFNAKLSAQQLITETQNPIKISDFIVSNSKVDNMPIVNPATKMEMPNAQITFIGTMPNGLLNKQKIKEMQEKMQELNAKLEKEKSRKPEFFKNLKPKKRTGLDLKLMID